MQNNRTCVVIDITWQLKCILKCTHVEDLVDKTLILCVAWKLFLIKSPYSAVSGLSWRRCYVYSRVYERNAKGLNFCFQTFLCKIQDKYFFFFTICLAANYVLVKYLTNCMTMFTAGMCHWSDSKLTEWDWEVERRGGRMLVNEGYSISYNIEMKSFLPKMWEQFVLAVTCTEFQLLS